MSKLLHSRIFRFLVCFLVVCCILPFDYNVPAGTTSIRVAARANVLLAKKHPDFSECFIRCPGCPVLSAMYGSL